MVTPLKVYVESPEDVAVAKAVTAESKIHVTDVDYAEWRKCKKRLVFGGNAKLFNYAVCLILKEDPDVYSKQKVSKMNGDLCNRLMELDKRRKELNMRGMAKNIVANLVECYTDGGTTGDEPFEYDVKDYLRCTGYAHWLSLATREEMSALVELVNSELRLSASDLNHVEQSGVLWLVFWDAVPEEAVPKKVECPAASTEVTPTVPPSAVSLKPNDLGFYLIALGQYLLFDYDYDHPFQSLSKFLGLTALARKKIASRIEQETHYSFDQALELARDGQRLILSGLNKSHGWDGTERG